LIGGGKRAGKFRQTSPLRSVANQVRPSATAPSAFFQNDPLPLQRRVKRCPLLAAHARPSRKPLPEKVRRTSSKSNEQIKSRGGEAPKGASNRGPHHALRCCHRQALRVRQRAFAQSPLTSRRFTAALARADASAIGSAPVRRFLRPGLAGVTRFGLSLVYLAPRRPVVMPVGPGPRAARERFATPRAGSAPAPH
jgi:hypothetical protein